MIRFINYYYAIFSYTLTVKQNYFEPPAMPSDILFNNNVPVGVWDDPDAEFQDIEDYPQYYQPPC